MSKVKIALVSIVVYLFLGFGIGCFIFYYTTDIGKANAIKGGVTAIAEIKYLDADIQQGSYPTLYNVRYEYISPEGIRYTEVIVLATSDKEEALSHIGEKVEIYIDGKGNSIPVGKELNVHSSLIVSIVFGLIAIAYTIGLIIVCIKEHRWEVGHKQHLAELAAKEAQEEPEDDNQT